MKCLKCKNTQDFGRILHQAWDAAVGGWVLSDSQDPFCVNCMSTGLVNHELERYFNEPAILSGEDLEVTIVRAEEAGNWKKLEQFDEGDYFNDRVVRRAYEGNRVFVAVRDDMGMTAIGVLDDDDKVDGFFQVV